jgi:hypothetical protein
MLWLIAECATISTAIMIVARPRLAAIRKADEIIVIIAGVYFQNIRQAGGHGIIIIIVVNILSLNMTDLLAIGIKHDNAEAVPGSCSVFPGSRPSLQSE